MQFDFCVLLLLYAHRRVCTRWFKYDREKLWLVYTQIVPVIFEPPCIIDNRSFSLYGHTARLSFIVCFPSLWDTEVVIVQGGSNMTGTNCD
jgi:hypothetical protein